MKILIFGAHGMLGNTLYKYLSEKNEFEVYGTIRQQTDEKDFYSKLDVRSNDVEDIFREVRPNVVLNAVGIIKQKKDKQYEKLCIEVNALWPRRLEEYAEKYNFRAINFSTDCVFSGRKGNYYESDFTDADDVYGVTKKLGEIQGESSLTLRTSIIGHELKAHVSLVDWFLSQENEVNGYVNAIYSGFPTIFVAKFLENYILPRPKLTGLYHFSSDPISKYELLKKVRERYSKDIEIHKNTDFVIDRSLNSDKIRKELSFTPPGWDELVDMMYKYRDI